MDVSNTLILYFTTQDPQYRGKGTTDGTFRDQRYFHCEDNCGLFVALDKLSPDAQGSSLTKEPRSGKSYAKVASHGPPEGGQSTPAANTRSRSQAISRHESKESSVDRLPPPRFNPGDRVVAFNKKGIPVHGKVRWVGRNTASQKHIITVAGIETVSSSHYFLYESVTASLAVLHLSLVSARFTNVSFIVHTGCCSECSRV